MSEAKPPSEDDEDDVRNKMPKYQRPKKESVGPIPRAPPAQPNLGIGGKIKRTLMSPYILFLFTRALAKMKLQDTEAAAAVTHKLIEATEQVYGSSSLEVVEKLLLLSQITYLSGDLDEHVQVLEKATKIISSVYPDGNNLRVVAAQSDLAEAYWDQGRENDAIRILEKAVGVSEGLLKNLSKTAEPLEWEATHHLLHEMKGDLGMMYDYHRKPREALALFVDSFVEAPFGGGYDNPQWFSRLNHMTWWDPTLDREGNKMKEEDINARGKKEFMWEVTVKNIAERMGKEHRGLVRPLYKSAQVTMLYGQNERATLHLKELMKIQTRLRGFGGSAVADVFFLMGMLCSNVKNFPEGRRLVETAKGLKGQAAGYEHLHISFYQYELALALLGSGMLNEGRSMATEAHRLLNAYIPQEKDHDHVLNVFLHVQREQLKNEIQTLISNHNLKVAASKAGLKLSPSAAAGLTEEQKLLALRKMLVPRNIAQTDELQNDKRLREKVTGFFREYEKLEEEEMSAPVKPDPLARKEPPKLSPKRVIEERGLKRRIRRDQQLEEEEQKK